MNTSPSSPNSADDQPRSPILPASQTSSTPQKRIPGSAVLSGLMAVIVLATGGYFTYAHWDAISNPHGIFSSFVSTATPKVPTGTVQEFPASGSGPYNITAGPDGNLWFTERGAIGRVTTSGSITNYPIPDSFGPPYSITAGPDGNLWFTSGLKNHIGKMSPTGSFTEYSLNPSYDVLSGIVSGPDGNLWFLVSPPQKLLIVRMTPSGSWSDFSTRYFGSGSGIGTSLVFGPDHNLWYIGNALNGTYIDEMSLDGTILEENYDPNGPNSLIKGPDGNIWTAEGNGNIIGRITPDGNITDFGLTYVNQAIGITAGPDGNLWFTETNNTSIYKIGRMTKDGNITDFSLPAGSDAYGITAGPDGNLWFTETNADLIGRISP